MSTPTSGQDITEITESADQYHIVVRANPDAGPFAGLLRGWNLQGRWMCSIQSRPIIMSIDDTSGNRKVEISIDIQITHDSIKTAVREAIKAYDQAANELDQPTILGSSTK